MTPLNSTSLAYRLFHAIRANKRKLLAALPPASLSDSPGYGQREALRGLVNALFAFESKFRGAQPALAGINPPPYFAMHASRYAKSLVLQMLDCQTELVGQVWAQILGVLGMSGDEFLDLVVTHIGTYRLPVMVKAFPGVEATLTGALAVQITLTTESASNQVERYMPLPFVEDRSLGEQLAVLNQYWGELKKFIRDTAKNLDNWPSLADSRKVERLRVSRLITNFFGKLSKEECALVKKDARYAIELFTEYVEL